MAAHRGRPAATTCHSTLSRPSSGGPWPKRLWRCRAPLYKATWCWCVCVARRGETGLSSGGEAHAHETCLLRLQVSFRQKGNPVLDYIKNVRWQVCVFHPTSLFAPFTPC